MSDARPQAMCATCRWFRPNLHDSDGECRRHPPALPQPDTEAGIAAAFPMTSRAHWCGEHKALSNG